MNYFTRVQFCRGVVVIHCDKCVVCVRRVNLKKKVPVFTRLLTNSGIKHRGCVPGISEVLRVRVIWNLRLRGRCFPPFCTGIGLIKEAPNEKK